MPDALEGALHELMPTIATHSQEIGAACAALQRNAEAAARFEREAQGAVLATCSLPLGSLCYAYFSQRLHTFASQCGYAPDDDAADGDVDMATRVAHAQELRAKLHFSANALGALGLGGVVEDSLARVCAAALRARLDSKARGEFSFGGLETTRNWLRAVLLPYVTILLSALARADAVSAWHARLEHALHMALGTLRISELFNIIVDYPDSQAALDDLSACLEHTTLATTLGATFSEALQRRLLHAGAATQDILTQYINTIKVLREIDPGGAILEQVSGPVRAYLRHRKDTIRCVVTMLTDDAGEGTSLMDLEATDPRPTPGAGDGDSDVDGDAALAPGWDMWQPAASHAASIMSATRAGSRGDVVGQLVGVFGSRELFVNEYRSLLADRLLSRGGYDTDREVRTLELLKLRFGEHLLHACEVMIKDIADSRRLDANVKQGQPAGGSLQGMAATVISQLFWPQLGAEAGADITLPPRVAAALKAYGERYETLKAPRKLVWKPALGSVTVSLTVGAQVREFTVSPGHATVICAFHKHDEWDEAQLAATTGMSAQALAARAGFWVKAGVLVRSGNGYAVVNAFGSVSAAEAGALNDEGGAGGAVASAEEQAAAEMHVYEQYVLGMLVNFDNLPLERIHNMLRMFVADPPYDKSIHQLERFLGRLVLEEKLSSEGGVYRRRKQA